MDYELILETGLKKIEGYTNDPKKFFVKSFLAGLYLGLAMILAYTLGAMLSHIDPILGSIGVSVFFGIAFIMIVFLNGELFTGNVFFTLIPVLSHKKKGSLLLPMWSLNYLGNSLGLILICVLFIYSGAQAKYVGEYVLHATSAKLAYTAMQVFIKSILCNFIVCVAGYASVKIKDDMAKVTVMLLIVMAFVLPGLDHSIANIGVYTMGLMAAGNLDALNPILWFTFISTIGNVIGGAFLLAFPLYYIVKPSSKA